MFWWQIYRRNPFDGVENVGRIHENTKKLALDKYAQLIGLGSAADLVQLKKTVGPIDAYKLRTNPLTGEPYK